MALHVRDMRGLVHDDTPEDTLDTKWKDALPQADRFGVHSILEFRFADTPGHTIVAVNGDRMHGVFKVPRSEVWEVYSIEQFLNAASGAGIYSNVSTRVWPKYSEFSFPPAAAYWKEKAGLLYAYPITRPVFFSGTQEWTTRDEASETDPNAGLRKRILYANQDLLCWVDHGANVTVNRWLVRIDCVRYPSTSRLLEMLDAGEVTERELFAALALRYPSPAEAF